jgi:hypothetical protein
MAILFTHYWDVVENKEKEYEDFILKTYIPAYTKTGLRLAGAYYVVVGAGPRIISVSTADDPVQFQKAITSEAYGQLQEQLSPFVRNYACKLFRSCGPFGVEKYEMQFGVWKFNQYFNILPGAEEAYKEFEREEFVPAMERLGMKVTGIWRTVIGSSPFMLVEGTSPKIEAIAKTIATDEYRSLTRVLKSRYVQDYQSRILAPTKRLELPYFMKKLTAGL